MMFGISMYVYVGHTTSQEELEAIGSFFLWWGSGLEPLSPAPQKDVVVQSLARKITCHSLVLGMEKLAVADSCFLRQLSDEYHSEFST